MEKRGKGALGRPATIAAPRETILSHAAKLFAEKGFDGASLQDVAKAVGISKAAVYHYFPTKQDIYDDIVIDLLSRLRTAVQDRIESSAPFSEQLRQMMTGHAEFFESNYESFVTLLHGFGGLSRTLGKGQVSVRDEYETMIRKLMTDAKASGDLTMGDPAICARAVLSMLNWMARWYRPGGRLSAHDFAEEYYSLIYNGLKPR
jgi:AcrR family transcriptional regulator